MKIFKKKKKTIYNFDYRIIYKNQTEETGTIVNSEFGVRELFLIDATTEFSNGKIYYYNSDGILRIRITNYKETYE